MPFCPVCKTEYREGFTTCSDCDASLVEQLPAEPPRDERWDGSMVVVFIPRDDAEAQIVVGILQSEGIGCYVTPEVARTSRMMGIVVDWQQQQGIMVLESDVERAHDVIEQAMEAGKCELRESD